MNKLHSKHYMYTNIYTFPVLYNLSDRLRCRMIFICIRKKMISGMILMKMSLLIFADMFIDILFLSSGIMKNQFY